MVSTNFASNSSADVCSTTTVFNRVDSATALFVKESKTEVLPIILILGPPGSGKGTLCKRLAAEFNLYHLSVGDWLRARAQVPIAGVSDCVNRYVSQDAALPEELIEAEFGSFDNAPAPLMLYQCSVLNVSTPESLKINAMQPLKEECERISAQGGYSGILVDNLQQSLGHCDAAAETFGGGFPQLLIAIDCADETAKKRFLGRARGSDSASRFDRRCAKFRKHYESIVQHIGVSAPVVRVSTEVDTGEAYRQLLRDLGRCEAWHEMQWQSSDSRCLND